MYGGADSWRYTMEKLSRKPLPMPHKSLEKYSAPNEVVTVMITMAMMTISDESIIEWRRPRWAPTGPVNMAPMKAPRIMKDEIIC